MSTDTGPDKTINGSQPTLRALECQSRTLLLGLNLTRGRFAAGCQYNTRQGAAKAAVNNMSEGLANSWARYNIAVNVVAPGKKQNEKAEEKEDARKLRHVSLQYVTCYV